MAYLKDIGPLSRMGQYNGCFADTTAPCFMSNTHRREELDVKATFVVHGRVSVRAKVEHNTLLNGVGEKLVQHGYSPILTAGGNHLYEDKNGNRITLNKHNTQSVLRMLERGK